MWLFLLHKHTSKKLMPNIIRSKGYTSSLFHTPPSILNVDNMWKRPRWPRYFDHVKTVSVSRPTPSHHPKFGHQREDLSFPPANRLPAGAEATPGPRFDLNEGHQMSPSSHQVEVVVAKPEPVGFDLPPMGFEVLGGRELAREAAAMAGVSPLVDRANDVRHWHGTTIGRQRAGGLTF